jgi:hypothetical protein
VSVERTNVVIGSVRRLADDRGVTLHVDGSTNALGGAARFALVPLTCLTLGVYFVFTTLPRLRDADAPGTFACFAVIGLGIIILPCAAVLPIIRRLLQTALRRVTIDAEVAQLRLLAFGSGRPVCRTWQRESVRDVLVHTRSAGLHELHILIAGEPPVTLLYGVSRDELEFIAAELRRVLDVRPDPFASQTSA